MFSFHRILLALSLVCAGVNHARAIELYGVTPNGTFINWDLQDYSGLDRAQLLQHGFVERMVAMDWDPTHPELGPIMVFRNPDELSIQRLPLDDLGLNHLGDVDLAEAERQIAGANFGADISPVTGRLRVVTNAGLNLDIELNEFNDSPPTFNILPKLSYAAGDLREGYTPSVAHIAYGLNDDGDEVLYGIDNELAALVRFDESDGATLHTVGTLGAPPFSFHDVGPVGGFDIDVQSGRAFLAADTRYLGRTTLFEFNPATGEGISTRGIPAGEDLVAFAVVPEPSTIFLLLANTIAAGGCGMRIKCSRRDRRCGPA